MSGFESPQNTQTTGKSCFEPSGEDREHKSSLLLDPASWSSHSGSFSNLHGTNATLTTDLAGQVNASVKDLIDTSMLDFDQIGTLSLSSSWSTLPSATSIAGDFQMDHNQYRGRYSAPQSQTQPIWQRRMISKGITPQEEYYDPSTNRDYKGASANEFATLALGVHQEDITKMTEDESMLLMLNEPQSSTSKDFAPNMAFDNEVDTLRDNNTLDSNSNISYHQSSSMASGSRVSTITPSRLEPNQPTMGGGVHPLAFQNIARLSTCDPISKDLSANSLSSSCQTAFPSLGSSLPLSMTTASGSFRAISGKTGIRFSQDSESEYNKNEEEDVSTTNSDEDDDDDDKHDRHRYINKKRRSKADKKAANRRYSESSVSHLTNRKLSDNTDDDSDGLMKRAIQRVVVPKSHGKVRGRKGSAEHTEETAETRHLCPYPGCDKHFSTSGHARRHSRVHLSLRPFHCPHQGCDASFTRRDNCMQHQVNRHEFRIEVQRLPQEQEREKQ